MNGLNPKITEIIIFSIPEAIVIFCLASSFLGKRFEVKRLVMMAVSFGLIVSVIREVTGSFILNICLSSLVIILLLKFLGFFSLFEAATSGLSAISLYLVVEFLNVKTLQILTGIDPVMLSADFFLRIRWFLLQIITAFVLSIVIRYLVTHPFGHEVKKDRYKA